MMARHGGDILRLCLLYLGDRQLAEDAFQETFVKAWRHRDAFRGECSERTWLSRIAVNTCRDMLRRGWFRLMRRSQPIETLLDLAAPQHADAAPVRDAVLTLPRWMLVWIGVIAVIKLVSVLSGLIVQGRFVAEHTPLNKLTGLLLFALPLLLPVIDLKLVGGVVCAVATLAAAQEGHLIRTGKSIE